LSNTANLTVTPAEYAYVTNFAENTVSTFSVGPAGSLVAATATPIATGSQPYALAADATGHYLYVGNYSGKNAGTISEYTIGAGGVLTALATIATGAGPNGLTVNNGYLYVANLGDSTVDWYTINTTTGQLSALTSATKIVSGSSTAGAAAVNFNTITAGTFAYVSNYTANTISIFSVNSTTGALTALTSGATVALPTGSTGPVEVAFDKSGKYAYVVDFTSGDIAQYTVNDDGSLTAFTTSPVIALGGAPRWITIDTTTNTAYVPNAGTNSIQVLSVGTTGVLTLTASEALAANSSGVAANPSYVALDQTGAFLYAAERGGTSTGLTAPYNNLMAQFSVSDTGALAPLATPTVATGTTSASEPAEIAFSLAY
jgi:6-phosphogluconolactonase (cycloisomerase 2 family)